MTNLEKLLLLGEVLHGPRWQRAVARDLGVCHPQIHRWLSGTYMPYEKHIAALVKIAKQRQNEIAEVIRRTT